MVFFICQFDFGSLIVMSVHQVYVCGPKRTNVKQKSCKREHRIPRLQARKQDRKKGTEKCKIHYYTQQYLRKRNQRHAACENPKLHEPNIRIILKKIDTTLPRKFQIVVPQNGSYMLPFHFFPIGQKNMFDVTSRCKSTCKSTSFGAFEIQ